MPDKTRIVGNLVSDNNIFSDVVNDRVGIGTTIPTSKLDVSGNINVSGVITASSFSGTATTSINVIGGIGSITTLQVTGLSTFSNGPVFIGAATSTGTSSQPLQVTGGAYVSGNIGIGTTNPSSNLHIVGNSLFTGVSTSTGRVTLSGAGTSGSPLLGITGTWTTGAGTTNTKPQVLIEPVGTISTTWSNVGTGLGVNAGAGFTGNLIDLQVGGTSVLNSSTSQLIQYFNGSTTTFLSATISNNSVLIRGIVPPTGGISIQGEGNGTSAGFSIGNNLTVNSNSLHWGDNNNDTGGYVFLSPGIPSALVSNRSGTTSILSLNSSGIKFAAASYISWGASHAGRESLSATDLILARDTSNILAQRNSTNAQTFRIYNRYVGVTTNFERANLGWNNNVFIVGTEKGSTIGTARQMEFQTDGTTRVAISTTGNVGIGTTTPTEVLTVLGKVQVQQDSGSNNRVTLRGQPSSSYRWNIDNYSSSNNFRIFREDDTTATNGYVGLSIDPTGGTIISGITTVGLANTSLPPSNSQMSFELTNNTTLTVRVRGTDGIVRTGTITLT